MLTQTPLVSGFPPTLASTNNRDVLNALIDRGNAFGNRPGGTSGLVYGYHGGPLLTATGVVVVLNGTLTLTASTTNYVEVDSTGSVTSNTSSFTAGRLSMATVITGPRLIQTITDNRAFNVISGSSGSSSLTVGTTAIASGTTTRILYDNAGVLGEYTLTGTGTAVVMATSPTLVTPVLGVATATSINKMAITAPATSSTLAVADGKTLAASNTMTFTSTDGISVNFGTTSGAVLYSNIADQTIAGGANVTSLTQSTGNITIDCGLRPLQFITNGGAFTITAPASDGSCMLLVTNNGSAGTITFSGFSVGSNTGDTLTTTNTNKFTISIWRINGTSGYRVAAHQ